MLSALLLICLSTLAEAKDRPTVAVVGVHDAALDRAGQERAATAITDAIAADRRARALPPSDVARAIAGRESAVLSESVVGPAKRLLEDGRILHDQAQPEEAAPVLERAVAELREAMQIADASRELWEALLYLGASRLATGESKAADAAWEAAAALNPVRQPDPARLPPTVVERYRAIQERVAARKATIVVRATGATEITIDGRSADARGESLPAGAHHVRAAGPEGRSAHRLVTAAPGATETVDLTLGPPRLAVPASTSFALGRQTSELYRALGSASGADLVLVAGGADGRASAQLYSRAADRFGAPVEFAYEGALDDELIAALPAVLATMTEDGAVAPAGSTTTAASLDPSANALLAQLLRAPAPPAPIVTRSGKRWIYVAAGAAGAAVLGGGIAAAALTSDGDRGTIIVGPVP
jgi:hypothetical protein